MSHLLVDGPTLLGAGASTADAWTARRQRRGRVRPRPRRHLPGVVAAARLPGRPVVPRLPRLRPRLGVPGLPRDLARGPPRTDKAPYDPARAQRPPSTATSTTSWRPSGGRLEDHRRDRDGRPGVVVVAYDTELFGHWWHEGPQFLERVLRALPAAGVRLTTLAGAIEAGHVAGPGRPRAGVVGLGQGLAGLGRGRGRRRRRDQRRRPASAARRSSTQRRRPAPADDVPSSTSWPATRSSPWPATGPSW